MPTFNVICHEVNKCHTILLFLNFKNLLLFMWVSVIVCRYPWRLEEIIWRCRWLQTAWSGCQKPIPGTQQEHELHRTVKPSFEAQLPFILNVINFRETLFLL